MMMNVWLLLPKSLSKEVTLTETKGKWKIQWTSTPGPGQPVDFPASLAMQKESEAMVNSQPGWSSVCRTESKQGQAVARCGGFQVHWQFLGYRGSKQLTHVPAFHWETWMPKESHQAMVLISILSRHHAGYFSKTSEENTLVWAIETKESVALFAKANAEANGSTIVFSLTFWLRFYVVQSWRFAFLANSKTTPITYVLIAISNERHWSLFILISLFFNSNMWVCSSILLLLALCCYLIVHR